MMRIFLKMALGFCFVFPCLVFAEAPQYSPGVTDTTIKIGNTIPYTGPLALLSQAAKIEGLVFQMINEQGGINGRKIEFISRDDAYNPANTVKEVRRLVEQDHVFLIFSTLGTGPNLAIRDFLNREKIPQLLLLSGYSKLNDPKNFPYTFPGAPSYLEEGKLMGKLILQQHPNEKIAVLYQNDDYGKDLLDGLMQGLGVSAKLVSEQSYEVTSPSVDSQIINLQHSGASVFVNFSAPRAAAQAIRKIADLNWKTAQYLNLVSTSKKLLDSLGEDKTKGIQSFTVFKDISISKFKNDQDVKEYLAFMSQYAPGSDPSDFLNKTGYCEAQALVLILKKAGNNLTRENIKNIAANLNVAIPMMIGKLSNTPADYSLMTVYQPIVFDGHEWRLSASSHT
jgi:ABC-type branched-subunit amino acid transport system substrate-binding protein